MLRLFGIHTERQLEKGIDLEAQELEIFELAWDKKAQARCRQCKGEVTGMAAGLFHAKAPQCERAECTISSVEICRACRSPSETEMGWHTCPVCPRAALAAPKGPDSSLQKSLKRQHENLRIYNNFYKTANESGEPAIKRKRT